jgi:hypothetical protein
MGMKENLKKLREPFPQHQISQLPKPTKQQTDAVKADFKAGIRCTICGAWHHPQVVHLPYVGHAALTDRLLDVDPEWTWEPLAIGQDGYPVIDNNGGMWIKLTVCGVTRLGYGDAQGKTGGDAMKERIGDALRNAAMRFGAALDLWHKGDLHVDEDATPATHTEAHTGSNELPWLNLTPKMITSMKQSIESKERTAEQIIKNLSETHRLSKATKDQIKALEGESA